ncbi:hypothetical protein [uncultured Paraglaciecola sp.]|uniref:hypothetical protein n=1 Tax=uncultured Paraglaciecola sp. TaxID=1765024 RepID=UPI00262132BC|nr:hypothetical protein [uncultured Paraglaciecola sp.]
MGAIALFPVLDTITLAASDFEYSECPFTQSDALRRATRDYPEATTAAAALGAKPGDTVEYITPINGDLYTWVMQSDNTLRLDSGPDIPIYRFEKEAGVTDTALADADVKNGFVWIETNILTGVSIRWISVGDEGPLEDAVDNYINLPEVASAQELRELDNPAYQNIKLKGTEEGEFYWDPTSTLAENGVGSPKSSGTVIAMDGHGGAGRYRRVYEGPVYPKWFGAIRDSDSTIHVQAAFNVGGKSVIDEPYLINGVDPAYPVSLYGGGVKPLSYSNVEYVGEGKLTVVPNDKPAYVVMNLSGTTGVNINNGEVIGDINTHTDTGGEYGFGYLMFPAFDFVLSNCKASNFWGDGFYVSGDEAPITGYPSTGGVIFNGIADNNRRQGLSIVSWVGGNVIGGVYKNTGRTLSTAPSYGIDIEPNPKNCSIDVTLINVKTENNLNGGIQFVPGFLTHPDAEGNPYRVVVDNYVSYKDGINGAMRFAFPDFAQLGVNKDNAINGEITINSPRIIESERAGIDFSRWASNAPDVKIIDPTVIDCNTEGYSGGLGGRCAYVVEMLSADDASYISTGKIDIVRPRAIDTRDTPLMLLPMYLHGGSATQYVDNVSIIDPHAENWSSASNTFVNWNKTKNGSVKYSKKKLTELGADKSIISGQHAGEHIYSDANSSTIKLPSAALSAGLEYNFINLNEITYNVLPFSGESIQGFDVDQSVSLKKITDSLSIYSDGSSWIPTIIRIFENEPIYYSAGMVVISGDKVISPITGAVWEAVSGGDYSISPDDEENSSHENFKRISGYTEAPLANLLPDSGRFVISTESKSRSITTFANADLNGYNGTTIVEGSKFIYDNSTHGGGGGALSASVQRMVALTGARRYGEEWYTAEITQGVTTNAPITVGATTYYLSALVNNASYMMSIGTDNRICYGFFIDVAAADEVLLKNIGTMIVDGAYSDTDVELSSGAHWVTWTYDKNTSSNNGYITSIPVYAVPSAVFEIAKIFVSPVECPVMKPWHSPINSMYREA